MCSIEMNLFLMVKFLSVIPKSADVMLFVWVKGKAAPAPAQSLHPSPP